MKKFRFLGLAMTTLCVSGCAVQLVSKYDEQTDQSATSMQKDFSSFFVKMQTSLTPNEASFGENQDFYRKQVVDIGAMELRASSIPKNELTTEQLQLVKYNLAWLALLHKGCVTGTLTAAQKAAVATHGVDASVKCQISYGANFDAPDRSAEVLNPALIPVVAGQFDTSLGAIMKLEIAKKRGES